jgi:hypothetical protein
MFVLANIREAIELHIESLIAAGEDVPEDVGKAIYPDRLSFPIPHDPESESDVAPPG